MDNNFMKEAVAQADKNLEAKEGGPFGAVVVKNGKIVGSGHNQVLLHNDPTCHAEMQAIRDACSKLGTFNLTGCTLYTSCYPCPMCMSAAIWADIKDIVYGNTAKDAENIGFRDKYIYDFMKKDCDDSAVVSLSQENRSLSIKTFENYALAKDNKLY
jgi:guanine deaminase